MKKFFRLKITLIILVFSLVITVSISFIDNNRLEKQVILENEAKLELIGKHIVDSIQTIDKAYSIFDEEIANKMKSVTSDLIEKYQENPNFKTWDFQMLYDKYKMNIFIIDSNNTIIYSNFEKDVGLNFNECCKNFANVLDKRRNESKFSHDSLDVQQKTGKLVKYSYQSTPDNKYIIELGYSLETDKIFQEFNFIKDVEDIIKQHDIINDITIFNIDGYALGKKIKIDDDRITYLEKSYKENKIIDVEGKINSQNVTYRYVPYQADKDKGVSTKRIVEIVYNNDNLETIIEENRKIYHKQILIITIISFVTSFIIAKLISRPMYLAWHDVLTGLHNRSAFETVLNQKLSKKDNKLALIILDLDNFKTVNDSLGHDKGDVLLKYLSYILKDTTKGLKSFVARLGGDEFVIIIEDYNSETEISGLASKIIYELYNQNNNHSCVSHLKNESITICDIIREFNVTISLGIAFAPKDATDSQSLYKKADIALYYSKNNGKNMYKIYSDDMN